MEYEYFYSAEVEVTEREAVEIIAAGRGPVFRRLVGEWETCHELPSVVDSHATNNTVGTTTLAGQDQAATGDPRATS